MGYYKEKFDALPCFQLPITQKTVERIIACCVYFENRDQNPSALNSPLLGVIPIYFTRTDRAMLHDVVGTSPEELDAICAESPYTEDHWIVTNDSYNHLVLYLIYRIFNAGALSGKLKTEGTMSLMKLLHYKFFTSLIYNSYPYGADEATMTYVVNNLTKKFGIAKLESWKMAIEERCIYLLSKESIHYDALHKYDDDTGIIYCLSDAESNLRQKIVRINRLYHEAKERNEAIGSYKSIDTIDGTKIISSQVEVFDSMIAGMKLQIQSPARLLDMELVEVITSKYREISRELFTMTLTKFCDLTATQAQSSNVKDTIQVMNKETGEKETIYTSCEYLLREFLQKTYRYCIMSKDVDATSKKSILLKTINIYTSSQMIDQDILTIKRSFVYFVTRTELSRRKATIMALSLCMIVYLLIRSFDYVK